MSNNQKELGDKFKPHHRLSVRFSIDVQGSLLNNVQPSLPHFAPPESFAGISDLNETNNESSSNLSSSTPSISSTSSSENGGNEVGDEFGSKMVPDEDEEEEANFDDKADRFLLIETAKSGKWTAVEDLLLRKMKRKDRRLNVTDPKTGLTTLMLACSHRRFLVVQRLCALGAALNIRCKDRRTPLHFAAASGHVHIVKELLSYSADPNMLGGENSQLPLHIAANRKVGGLATSQMLLAASLKSSLAMRDALGNLPITYAVERGNCALVREMLKTADSPLVLEQTQWQSETRDGDYLVHKAARLRNVDVMAILGFDGSADVNVRNRYSQTPLHIATRLGDIAMVKLLYSLRADADLIDNKELAPLHIASECGHTEIVDFLIERYKAEIHLRTKDGSTLMHLSAEKGFADTVLSFIKLGLPVNMPNKAGNLCLHAAAQNGHLQVVRTLIAKGSSVDARTKDGYTALHLAVLQNQPEIIQALLGFGAKVDLKGGPLKEAPLHIASRMQNGFYCAEMLMKSGANVNNATEETRETPLHISARSGSLELLTLLLEEGADPSRTNRAGETPLHLAVRHCHFEIARTIVKFCANNIKGKDAAHLIKMANNEGETTFHIAVELGKSQSHHPFEEIDIIRLLLENGADPLATTLLTNETSLHYCARSGNPDIFQEIVKYLGGSFQLACNRQDKIGCSPLMTSCEQGQAGLAEILLTNIARADVFDEHGKAALHLAAENGHISCCELLLNHKAFVNAKSKLGIAPLHLAAQSGFTDVVRLLVVKYGAVVNALSLDKKTPLHLAAAAGRKDVCQLLISLEADVDAADSLGQTPLHLAAENDHADVVRIFIKNMPHLITAASKNGMTCAHIAAKKGSASVIKELMSFKRSLVTSSRNWVNDSLPLHLAVSGGHKEVVRALINAGALATAENAEGMTAIHLAAKEGNIEVLQSIPSKISLQATSLKNGLSAIHVAAFYGNAEVVRELQARVDINLKTEMPTMASVVSDPQLKALISTDYGLTPLHMASYMGRENVVRLILNNSNVQTDCETLLLGRLPIFYAAMNGHLVILSLLLSRSARHLRAKDKKLRRPLHLAAENGHIDMVAMLIAQGADINSCDEDGWTPVHYATKNGFIKVVKLLIETGAVSDLRTKDGGKTPLMLSAAGIHINLLNYLLERPYNSETLMEDKTFLMDLMLCGKSNENESIEAFILHSDAPLYTAALLSKLYRDLAGREKERAKDLNQLCRHCERIATKLLGIAAEQAPPSAILCAVDSRGNQFIDMLLENSMKEVVEHAAVQHYLSDVWAGSLTKWSSSRFFLLIVGFLLFPPILAYFVMPFRHHNYHRIPVIKFLAMIASHLYLIGFLSIIAAIPIDPIVNRQDFFPTWYEFVCLAWISGMLVTELTKPGASTGFGMLRYVIIFFAIIATLFQIAAIVIEHGDHGREFSLILMYLRNFMLSFSLFAAIILIIDFFLIHHLFGPFGIIISSVLRDLMVFIVVLMLFLVGYSFQVACLFSPLKVEGSEFLTTTPAHNIDHLRYNPGHDIAPPTHHAPQINSHSLSHSSENSHNFSVGTSLDPTKISANVPNEHENLLLKSGTSEVVPSMTHEERGQEEKPKCKPRKKVIKVDEGGSQHHKKRRKRRSSAPASSHGGKTEPLEFDSAGRILQRHIMYPVISNRYASTLVTLFSTLYFAMFAMGKPEILPRVENGPDWSDDLFQIYFGIWMITAVIVLIPLLIAMLTETYKKIHMRSDLEWKFSRAKLIRDMIKMPAAPSPINLFVRAYLYARSVAKHGRLMFTVYAQFHANEDEHEIGDEIDKLRHHLHHHKSSDTANIKTGLAKLIKSKLFHLKKAEDDLEKNPKVDIKELWESIQGQIEADKNAYQTPGIEMDRRLSRYPQNHGPRRMSQVLDWSNVVGTFMALHRRPSSISTDVIERPSHH